MSVLGLPAEAASISTLGRPDAIRCWPGDGRIPTHFRRNLSVIPPAGGKSRCISHVFHPGEKKAEKRLDIGTKHDQNHVSKCQILQHLQHHPASSSTSAYLGHPDRLENRFKALSTLSFKVNGSRAFPKLATDAPNTREISSQKLFETTLMRMVPMSFQGEYPLVN